MQRRTESVLGLLRLGPSNAESDAVLLDRFAHQRDEAAFAALVHRHGPMVLGVCRRTLGDAHAAEDAFQAAFLVLARKAGSLTRPEMLAGWLHGVARRVALKARSVDPLQGRRLPQGAFAPLDRVRDPLAELSGRELLAILEDEVQRLPAAYRLPIALCYLEGLSQEEAAKRLGCTSGSLRGRLERGRSRLFARLSSRGLVPAIVAALSGLDQVAMAAGVPEGLAAQVTRAARHYSIDARVGEMIPPNPRLLAERVLNAMFLSKLCTGAAALLAVVLIAGSAVLGNHALADGDPAVPARARAAEARMPAPVPKDATKPKPEFAVVKKLHGRWIGRGLVPVVFTFRADGSFERSVLDERSEGSWEMTWDALPPTLSMTYTKSDNATLLNTTHKRKVIQLDDAVFAIENKDGLGPISYTRVKP
jgi:RNA polymerase sigma factor (sigma-70 family)